MSRMLQKIATICILGTGLIFFGILSSCGGGSGDPGGTITLSAIGQFPVQTNASFSTTGEIAQCSFLCEATVSSGGLLLMSASLNASVECFDGKPLGGEVQFFDRAEVSVPNFDHALDLQFSCTNLAEDLILGVVGGFSGNASFRARDGEDVELEALSLFRKDIVNIDFCYGNRIETLVVTELVFLCTREEDGYTGLGGLCSLPPEEQVIRLGIFFDCPYCGDGLLDGSEDCENNEDCDGDQFCNFCQCKSGECGDGFITGSEECDPDSEETNLGCPDDLSCDLKCHCFGNCLSGPELCDDGCDNDGDRKVDCFDEDCCGLKACVGEGVCEGPIIISS